MAQVSTRVRLAVLAAVLGLSVSGLTACSDDPPSGSPPPSSTSSSPTSPSPSGPPTLPAEAKGRSPEAAEAFVRYYVDLINYAIETLDTNPLEDQSNPSCSACRAIAVAAKNMRAAGRHYEGGVWRLSDLRTISAPKGHRAFQTVIDVDRLLVVEETGQRKVIKAHTTALAFDVTSVRGSWQVNRMVGVTQ